MNVGRSAQVIGIGSCAVDYLFTVPHMPKFGSITRASHFLEQGGGVIGNTLVALARLGVKTEMVACIGDDTVGEMIRAGLLMEGVGVSYLKIEKTKLSQLLAVIVDEDTGERSFINRSATVSAVHVDESLRDAIGSAQILCLDNINESTLQAARFARENGICTVLDPFGTYATQSPLLRYIDVPIVAQRFAEEWFPDSPHQMTTEALVNLGAKIAIVTLGAKGCVVSWNKGTFHYSAYPVNVVDTNGAGDAFHSGFIYGLLQGWPIGDNVRFASAVGGLACRSLGGRTALPNYEEVDAYMKEHAGQIIETQLS